MTFLPAVLVTVGIAVLSLTESTHMPSVSVNDKLVHGLMYALLAASWLVPVLRKFSIFHSQLSIYVIVLIGTTAYGALMEVLQRFCTLTRSGNMADLYADFIGALVGVIIVAIISIVNKSSNRQSSNRQ